MGSITGIAWVGPLLDRGGYGNVARNFAIGLNDSGMPVRTFPIGPNHKDITSSTKERILRMRSTDLGRRPLLVVHATPDAIWRLRWHGFSRTACKTVFETDRIPSGWLAPLRDVDEVWVPSQFNIQTFNASGVEARRLHKFPYGIDTSFWSTHVRDTMRQQLPTERPFRFLYSFAFGWRKGFDLLLRAYREAFNSRDHVELVLKVFGAPDARRQLLSAFESGRDGPKSLLPALTILDQPFGVDDLRALYASADCYISTERANGWGMPAMECMSMGIPCATINWGGATEFMDDSTAILMRPESQMEPVHYSLSESAPHCYKGHAWPAVRIDTVRDALLHIYNMADAERNSIGRRAADHIQRNFSTPVVIDHLYRYIRSLDVANSSSAPQINQRLLDMRSLRYVYGTRPIVKRLTKDVISQARTFFDSRH
jgi:glycosyltransferase involved in cell wall biosynthesis